jgi:biopolymer transport protein ExbB
MLSFHSRPRAALLLILATGLISLAAAGRLCAQPSSVGDAPLAGPTEPLVANDVIPTRNLLQVMRDGGPLMVPIGLCSIVLLVFVFERSIVLRRGRVIPRPFVKRFLQQMREGQLDADAALELCEKNRSPVAEVFAAAVRKWGRPSVEVEQGIIDAGERVTNGLRKHLRVLNGVSTISPLLGLLGTVFGMIQTFNAISRSDAMGRSEMLAGGIGQALLTTAGGLCVAIPALIAYLYFVGRIDQLIMDIDALAQRVVDQIASDAHPPKSTETEAPPAKRSKKVA